jgi:hypothetical protein
MKMSTKRPVKPRTTGLLGLFGHTYKPDEETGEPRIHYQFEVIRKLSGNKYAVQLFSWWDGCRIEIEIYTEDFLCSPEVKLYPSEEAWKWAYEKERHRRDREEKAGREAA